MALEITARRIGHANEEQVLERIEMNEKLTRLLRPVPTHDLTLIFAGRWSVREARLALMQLADKLEPAHLAGTDR